MFTMLIAFFDTETTGFAPKKDRVCQIGVIIGELHGKEFFETRRINQYFKIDFEMPAGAGAVNGLTKDFLEKFSHINDHMKEILHWFNKVDIIVAHNYSYDHKMMQGEFELWQEYCRELGINDNSKYMTRDYWTNKQSICTMKGSGYGKSIKLSALHEDLFGEGFEGAHDAMADILATQRCFLKLLDKGVITLPSNI